MAEVTAAAAEVAVAAAVVAAVAAAVVVAAGSGPLLLPDTRSRASCCWRVHPQPGVGAMVPAKMAVNRMMISIIHVHSKLSLS